LQASNCIGEINLYVDAFFQRDADIVKIVERSIEGKRIFKEFPVRYTFYHTDPKGKFQSIYGEPLSRVICRNSKDFRKELSIHNNKKLYEADINPIFSTLSENYLNAEPPKLNVAFWDIEVDFDPERGYASPEDAFMPITAIAVHLQWIDTLVCLAIPPKGMSIEKAEELVKDLPNTHIFDNEADLLDTFLNLIQDADVLSGWNSEGFDMPYTVNRITKVLSKDDTRRLCLWDQYPKKREYEKYGKKAITYDLVGRVHLDSLELYRKYTYEERHTYRLDAIGEMEVGETKTVYEGTLDQLYNNDFRKFIIYNRQDTALLDKLDKKLKFLDLSNTLAHECTVLLQTTMGAVAVTEQAIINEAHKRGFQVPNRPTRDEEADNSAAGAYVAYPKEGIHDWIGSLDINSLYPSAIRALNMGPETIVGQLRQTMTQEYIDNLVAKGKSFASAWEGMFGSIEYTAVMNQEVGTEITIDWQDGSVDVLSAAEVYKLIFDSNQPFMLSANGTLFTYEKEGIIPGLLKRWYAERKEMQAKLKDTIKAGNKIEEEYWDKRQLVKKINLNSLYGAILNPGCRFFDKRIGQSTTLTGRAIARHMAGKVNEIITGENSHVGKAIIYGDTDSCYFSAYKTLKKEIDTKQIPWSKESVVQLYDQIGEEVNTTFPKFMLDAFHCPKTRGEVIKAGRELVAIKGLFITKKRYAVLYYDKEGKRSDVEGKPGKIKAMGLDLKRSDTPEFIQNFLSDVLEKVLTGTTEQEVLDFITEFRTNFKIRPGWEKGSPKRANNISAYRGKEEKAGKTNMPGHVRASLNWNTLKRMMDDKYSMSITDGAKVIVCKLKDNPLGFTSVAYPVDELRLPQWFKDLPFNHEEMEQTIIDNKLDNLIGVLNWDIRSTEQTNTFNKLFDF
jgi:DNA polymerase elongation subunit (family B)